MNKQYDIVTDMLGATIQHGPANSRIYLMHLNQSEPLRLIRQMADLAEKNRYSKIFAKIPAECSRHFLEQGFVREARVPGFFGGRGEALFLGRYFNSARAIESDPDELDRIIRLARKKASAASEKRQLPSDLTIRPCIPDDVSRMARIYRQVFASYPFPIHQPEYLAATMAENIRYFAVTCKNRLVALASAETDPHNLNCEMTDFATLPDFRGLGLARCLLKTMELAVQKDGFKTAYTIARSVSAAMNITFSRSGYLFGGRLKNNTYIAGKIESMNVWYRHLRQS